MKVFNKIKNVLIKYRPNKINCLLYFFLPLFFSTFLINVKSQTDVWFLLNHGKYVLKHGFPIIEPFSVHQGLSFVMQQWLSSVIFYIAHSINSTYGLFILCFLINCLILYFLYKLCMEMSNNNYRISTFISIVIDLILLILSYITTRPQIFTYLLLVVTLYIMEKFYKNEKTKAIYFMILISFLQINLHAAMYFMLYIFMLPYMANYIILKIKNKKDNRVFKLLLIWAIMFIVAFINPYGIKAITYIFNSYGNYYVNEMIKEMHFVTLDNLIGRLFYGSFAIILTFFIYYKNHRLNFRHFLLFLGLTFLGMQHYRNTSLWFIGAIPIISEFFGYRVWKKEKINIRVNYIILIVTSIFIIGVAGSLYQTSPKFYMEKGIDKLLKSDNLSNVNVYADYNSGAYVEYRGIKSYIDARAEVFYYDKSKKDIIKEYYDLQYGNLNYKKFIDNYKFSYLIISEDDNIYKKVNKDKNFKSIYNGKGYKIFKNLVLYDINQQ